MAKTTLREIFLLRAISCLCIVLLHSVTRVYDVEDGWVSYVKLFLSFGTPAFVLISELVIANAYPDGTPKGFLTKRLRYIGIPFLAFGVLYEVQATFTGAGSGTLSELAVNVFRAIVLGESSVYFIAIIFQFYLLHMLCVRYVFNRFRPWTVLTAAALINAAYLGFFNLTQAPPGAAAAFVWERFYRMPFPGWLLYFAVAYYIGRNYAEQLKRIVRLRGLLYAIVPVCAALMALMLYEGWVTAVSSKRIDMVPFTVGLVLLLIAASSRLRAIPQPLVRISQYSFGIYLIHPLMFSVVKYALGSVPALSNSALGIGVFFVLGLSLSIIAVHILYRIPGGSYLVGKMGIGLPPDSSAGEKRRGRVRAKAAG